MGIKTYNYFLDGNLIFGEKRFIKKREKGQVEKTDSAPAKTDGTADSTGKEVTPEVKKGDKPKSTGPLETEVADTLTLGGQEGKQDATPKGKEGTEEKPAEKVQKPSEKAKLPPGEGADLYDFVYTTAVGLNTSINSPFVQVMLQGCAWMAQHGGFLFDMFSPDRFMKSLDGEKLANEQFTDKQKRLLKKQRLREIKDLPVDEKTGFNLNAYKDLSGIEASVKYVSFILFSGEAGKDEEITDPKILAARLSHWATDEKKIYKQDALKELNKEGRDIPKGTVIFFTEGYTGQLFTAYATGQRKEFVYFKPGLKNPTRFQLDAKDSPVQNEMALKAAFIPLYNTDQGYFAAHPQELSQDAYGTTLAAIEKLASKISETKTYKNASFKEDPDFKNLDTAKEVLRVLSETEKDVEIAAEALNELTEAQHPEATKKKDFLISQISIYRKMIKEFYDKYNEFVTDKKACEVEKRTKEKELAALAKDDPKRKELETAIKDLETKLKPYLEAQKESSSPDQILEALTKLERKAGDLLGKLNPKSEEKISVTGGEVKTDVKTDGTKVGDKQPDVKTPVKTTT